MWLWQSFFFLIMSFTCYWNIPTKMKDDWQSSTAVYKIWATLYGSYMYRSFEFQLYTHCSIIIHSQWIHNEEPARPITSRLFCYIIFIPHIKVCPDIFNIAWEILDFAHTISSPVLDLDILKLLSLGLRETGHSTPFLLEPKYVLWAIKATQRKYVGERVKDSLSQLRSLSTASTNCLPCKTTLSTNPPDDCTSHQQHMKQNFPGNPKNCYFDQWIWQEM